MGEAGQYVFVFVISERLKLGLVTETKAWRLAYGKACNNKYRTEMEAIFDFIDDLTKRLNRPIKDLDDIRYVMAALKEIRENEIKIDMLISPIEVSTVAWLWGLHTRHEMAFVPS